MARVALAASAPKLLLTATAYHPLGNSNCNSLNVSTSIIVLSILHALFTFPSCLIERTAGIPGVSKVVRGVIKNPPARRQKCLSYVLKKGIRNDLRSMLMQLRGVVMLCVYVCWSHSNFGKRPSYVGHSTATLF